MEKVTPLKNGTRPFQNLYNEHLSACAADAAMVFLIAARNRDLHEAELYARRLGGLRKRHARHLPEIIPPSEDPYELAEIKNAEDFGNHFRQVAAMPKITSKTEDAETIIRGLIVHDTSYIMSTVFRYARRHIDLAFLRTFMSAVNARELFDDEVGIIRLDSGIMLHSKIEAALQSVGIDPGTPKYPKKPPDLKLV